MIQKLPYKTFKESFKHVPRVAISLFIVNQNKDVLLTKRAKEPTANSWHLPGSFILKGESLDSCIKRIFKDELGAERLGKDAFCIFVSEDIDKDPRGHVIDLIYKVKPRGEVFRPVNYTKEIKYFKKLPDNIGFNHREVLKNLMQLLTKDILNLAGTFSPKTKKPVLLARKAIEKAYKRKTS